MAIADAALLLAVDRAQKTNSKLKNDQRAMYADQIAALLCIVIRIYSYIYIEQM